MPRPVPLEKPSTAPPVPEPSTAPPVPAPVVPKGGMVPRSKAKVVRGPGGDLSLLVIGRGDDIDQPFVSFLDDWKH